VEPARVCEDRASGRKDHRPGLGECLKALQPGNTLAVWKPDCLGRDLRHLVVLVDTLRDPGAEIDTTTANGRCSASSPRSRSSSTS
jgi:DNA invertase Pin-like site-specific DNA recombinase